MASNTKLATMLRRERVKRKHSLIAAGEAIGVSNETVRRWEFGLGLPQARLYGGLAKYLRLPIKQARGLYSALRIARAGKRLSAMRASA